MDITLDFSKVDDYITLNMIYSAQGKINNDPTKICGIINSEDEGFVYTTEKSFVLYAKNSKDLSIFLILIPLSVAKYHLPLKGSSRSCI